VKRFVADEFRVSMVVLGALVVAGFVAIGIGWRGVADSLVVAVQLPYAISGVFAGIAVIGFAAGLISVQLGRRRAAEERAEFGRVVNSAANLLAAVRSGQSR
jgi:hypothetical protein